jgi:hypothetical protein
MYLEVHMNNILIGQSDFRQIRESNAYYVDKSLFAEEIIQCPYLVILLTRPRRFGKTMNLIISQLFESFAYLLDDNSLSERQAADFKNIRNRSASKVSLGDALKFLSECLFLYHKKHVIILIDEYDTPIHSGYQYNYYEKIISFMRNLLSGGLKDNKFIYKGVVTGALRISRESLFTGLNNLGVFTLIEEEFNRCFGFTINEVQKILTDFGLSSYYEEILDWYSFPIRVSCVKNYLI